MVDDSEYIASSELVVKSAEMDIIGKKVIFSIKMPSQA
jgi:hypothetical protein